MTKNTMADLNNHLFACLERLNDEGLSGDELKAEVARAKAVGAVAAQIVANTSNVIEVARMRSELAPDDPARAALPRIGGAR